MPSKILFLVPYPLKQVPSQRFRFEQYFAILSRHGHTYVVQSFLTAQGWKIFLTKGHTFLKMVALLSGFAKRFSMLFRIRQFDFVFIHREATPLGPPVVEWLLAKILRAKIIYDFDDAIWLTDRKNESRLFRGIKWRSKVKQICRWAFKVSCGNEYLCDYARKVNQHVLYNPTTVDTEMLHKPDEVGKAHRQGVVTIGWTGSHTTTKYLAGIEKVLGQIQESNSNVSLLVIADRRPSLTIPYVFTAWSADTEIEDLAKIDIGIMPLPDDEWSKGKCGFKAIQYMALEIPCVLSPVGVNTQIVRNGVTGFLCSTDSEWFQALSTLIKDAGLRRSMGEAGRQTIVENYSVSSNTRSFLSLFEKA